MTTTELIQQLQALPAQTKVVVRGYEDGYNVPSTRDEIKGCEN